MLIKTFASAAAIVLATGISSATAGEDFTILRGLDVTPLSDLESARTRGTDIFTTLGGGNGKLNLSIPVELTDKLPVVRARAIREVAQGVIFINNGTVVVVD